MERCIRCSNTSRLQRRILIQSEQEVNSDSWGQENKLITNCLNVNEFETQLRHDSNATYGGITKVHLETVRRLWVEGLTTEPITLQPTPVY